MATAPRYEDWDALVTLLQRYAARKYGQPVVGLTLHLFHGGEHREPVPVTMHPQQAELQLHSADPPGPRPPAWAGNGRVPAHLSDFQAVWWPGLGLFDGLTEMQSKAVEVLWEAMEDGEWEVSQVEILKRIGSTGDRLHDVFRRSSAWGKLVVRGSRSGTYSLPRDPDEEVRETE